MAAKPYTEAQLKNMSVNPAVPGLITESYPDLELLIADSGLPDGLDADSFLRYVAYAYDKDSPLVVKHKDIKSRKAAASGITGFPVKDEHVPAIVRYLQRMDAMEWTLIISLERMFDELSERINDPIALTKQVVIKDREGSSSIEEVELSDEDVLKAVERKSKIKEEMKKLPGEIREARRAFFGDNELLEKAAKSVARTPEARQLV